MTDEASTQDQELGICLARHLVDLNGFVLIIERPLHGRDGNHGLTGDCCRCPAPVGAINRAFVALPINDPGTDLSPDSIAVSPDCRVSTSGHRKTAAAL